MDVPKATQEEERAQHDKWFEPASFVDDESP